MVSPQGWLNIEIGTLFRLVGGGTPSTTAEGYWGNGTPWISSADIDDGGAVTPRRSVTQEGIQNSTTNVVPAETVIVVTRVGLGKLAILSDKMCFSQDIQALVPLAPDIIDARFLRYSLIPIVRKFKYEGRGTTISGITKKQLSGVAIPLPPLAEQRRIVEKLDGLFFELDKAVEYLQSVKQQLHTYRQAVLKWAFESRPGDVKATLGDVAEIVGGITKGRDLSKHETICLPYLRVANVQDGYLDLSVMKEIEIKKDEVSKYLLKVDDVLYTEGGDKDKLGRGTIWTGEVPNCVHQNHVFRARINSGRAIAKFVALYSQSPVAKSYFFAHAKQTVNLASINLTVLKSLPISLPPLSKQQETVRTVEAQLSRYEKLEQMADEVLGRADSLRASILKRAFEGRLVPQNPIDEPAGKMLERIRVDGSAQKSSTKRGIANGR